MSICAILWRFTIKLTHGPNESGDRQEQDRRGTAHVQYHRKHDPHRRRSGCGLPVRGHSRFRSTRSPLGPQDPGRHLSPGGESRRGPRPQPGGVPQGLPRSGYLQEGSALFVLALPDRHQRDPRPPASPSSADGPEPGRRRRERRELAARWGAERPRPDRIERSLSRRRCRHGGAAGRAARGGDPQGIPGAHVPRDPGDPGRTALDGEDPPVSWARAVADPTRTAGHPRGCRRARSQRMKEQGDVMDCEAIRDDMLDVLYGEGGEAAARRLEAHQATCGECRREMAELRRLRADLSHWRLPEPLLARPAAPARSRRLPLGLAAAAILILASTAGLGLAGAEVRYDQSGLSVRLGRGTDARALADLERRHREELAALRAELAAVRPPDDRQLLRTV